MVKIYVITPYYKEEIGDLYLAHQSVITQDIDVVHVMIADGFPKEVISSWGCQHIILPVAHHDAGNFARGTGALHAFQEGADYVCFLDADNWLEQNHLYSLYSSVRLENCDVSVSRRILRRLDRTVLDPFDFESDGVRFADTGTVMLSRSAIEIAALWATLPRQLSGAGDRIIWAAINQRAFRIARTNMATTNYKTKWAVHYTGRGERAPPGTVDLKYVEAAHEYWMALNDQERQRIIQGRR